MMVKNLEALAEGRQNVRSGNGTAGQGKIMVVVHLIVILTHLVQGGGGKGAVGGNASSSTQAGNGGNGIFNINSVSWVLQHQLAIMDIMLEVVPTWLSFWFWLTGGGPSGGTGGNGGGGNGGAGGSGQSNGQANTGGGVRFWCLQWTESKHQQMVALE